MRDRLDMTVLAADKNGHTAQQKEEKLMKKALLVALMALVSSNALAIEVKSARLDAAKENILIDIAYGGGCEKHIFKLEVGTCLESYPVRCSAQLVDLGKPDACEAYIQETVTINLKEAGLADDYYERGSLTIFGSFGGSNSSSANVTLP